MKIRKFIGIAYILLALILFAGCSQDKKPVFEEMSPQKYQHISGYTISIPEKWSFSANENGVLFLNDDKSISLNIISEIGGMGYYNGLEIGEKVQEKLKPLLDELKIEETFSVSDANSQFHQLLSGKDGNNHVMTEVWMSEPVDGMRYYLFFTCGGNDYQLYKNVFQSIIKSVKFDFNEDVFALLNLNDKELAQKMKNGLQPME